MDFLRYDVGGRTPLGTKDFSLGPWKFLKKNPPFHADNQLGEDGSEQEHTLQVAYHGAEGWKMRKIQKEILLKAEIF